MGLLGMFIWVILSRSGEVDQAFGFMERCANSDNATVKPFLFVDFESLSGPINEPFGPENTIFNNNFVCNFNLAVS